MDPGPCTDLDRALGACGTGAAALPPPRPGRVHPCPPRHWAPPEAAQGAQHPQAPKAHTPGGQRPTAGRPNRGRRLCSPADPTAACARRRGGRAAAGHHLLGRRGSAGNAPGRSAIGLPQHPGATTCPSARYRYSCERVPDVAGTCNHAGMLRPPAPCVIMFLPPCLPLAASCSHGPPASPCTYSVHRTCSCPQHRTARSAGTCSARCRRRATTCGAYACVPIAESYGTATLRLVRALLIAYAARRRAGPARALTSARRLDRGWGADRAEGQENTIFCAATLAQAPSRRPCTPSLTHPRITHQPAQPAQLAHLALPATRRWRQRQRRQRMAWRWIPVRSLMRPWD